MPLRFSIPFVDDLLGGSVIYDEYRGDFARARTSAEAALDEARQGGAPERLADALLACGVVRLLKGEPLAALRYLDELDRLAANDPPRLLRALSYTYLARESYFNFARNGLYNRHLLPPHDPATLPALRIGRPPSGHRPDRQQPHHRSRPARQPGCWSVAPRR